MGAETTVVDPGALRRWQWAIMAAFGLGGITVSAWGPRLPAFKAELGIDTATIGLMLACVTIGAIAGLVVSAPVLHYLGSRRALTTSVGVVGAAMVLLGLGVAAASVPLVTVAFVIIGLATGSMDVLINVEGSAIEQAAARTLMPRMHGTWSVGAAVGSGIGAGCAALGISPQIQFMGEGVLIAMVAVVVAPWIPGGKREQAEEQHIDRRAKLRQWLRGWTDVRLLLIGLVMLGVELGEGSANNWLTLAVRTGHDETAAVAALFFTAFAIGEATARIFGGPLVDHLGRVHAIRYTTALGVVGVSLFILGDSVWIVLLGVLLWAIGVSMGFPLGMSAAAESGGNPAARVSVVASIGYFANLAGPPAIGLLAQGVGLVPSLWVLVVLFVAAFAASGALGPVRSKPGSEPVSAG